MRKNFILLLGSLVLSLSAGEFVARLVFRDITTTVDNRSYFALKWKQSSVRLNAEGFRERDIAADTTPGAFRVAFIGDSFTFGQGISESERMSNLLEGRLRARVDAIDVLNFGMSGNNTADELMVLNRVLDSVRPDYVLLQWFVNDVEHNASLRLATTVPQPTVVNRLKHSMRNLSVLYFLTAQGWHSLLERLGRFDDDFVEQASDPESPESKAAERAMLDFIATCREREVPLGIVLVPALVYMPDRQAYRYGFLHDRVLALCGREGVACTDLLDPFEPFLRDKNAYRSLWVNRFDTHMSALANQIGAEHLFQVFGTSIISAAQQRLAPANDTLTASAGAVNDALPSAAVPDIRHSRLSIPSERSLPSLP
jgi:lysophospholipase L1-like esterase